MDDKNAKILPNSLFVTVRTPEKVLYQGQATAVSSTNEKGPFDVLGEHGNFISVIFKNLVIHFENGQKQEFPVENGIIKVTENKVVVLLGVEGVNVL